MVNTETKILEGFRIWLIRPNPDPLLRVNRIRAFSKAGSEPLVLGDPGARGPGRARGDGQASQAGQCGPRNQETDRQRKQL